MKYDEQEVLANKDEFISSLLTKLGSLFQDSKLIIISRSSDKLTNLLSEILEKEIINSKIIVKCSNLENLAKKFI